MTTATHAAITLTDASYKKEVHDFSGVVLVDYWAAWCGPCRAMAPIIEELAAKYADNPKVKIGKLDVDANMEVAQTEMVMSLPTFKLFKNGEPVQMVVGMRPGQDLDKLIQEALKA